MRRLLACIVLGIFLCSGVVSASISISPETHHFDLTAGDSVTSNITVTNNGGDDIVGFIITEIEPDDEGIMVTYLADPDPFIAYPIFELGPYETIIFDMLIETDISLTPGVYTITTTFMRIEEEHTTSTEYIYKTTTKTVTVEDTERINELLALIADLEDIIDGLNDDSEVTINSLNAIIDALEDQIKELLDQSGSTDTEDGVDNIIYLLIFIIIVFLLIMLYLFVSLSKSKEKQIDIEKEEPKAKEVEKYETKNK